MLTENATGLPQVLHSLCSPVLIVWRILSPACYFFSMLMLPDVVLKRKEAEPSP